MNWKTEAMDRLRQYEGSRSAQKCLTIQVKDMEEDLCSPAPARPEAKVTQCVDYEDRRLNKLIFLELCRRRLRQTEAWLAAVDTALSVLTPEEKLTLHRLYISPRKGAVEELCAALGVERTSVYRIRDKALETFTLALFGISQ